VDPKRYTDVHVVIKQAAPTKDAGSYTWAEKCAALPSAVRPKDAPAASDDRAAMIVVTRDFAEAALAKAGAATEEADVPAATEWLFIIDCSGSMGGSRIKQVRQSLWL
jgi:Mg-chelatase subunit ChlD